MTGLPAELTIVPEDHGGPYNDGCNCTIARALKRVGVRMHVRNGYYVCGWGAVIDSDNKEVGQYRWKEMDEEFTRNTSHLSGTLVLKTRGTSW